MPNTHVGLRFYGAPFTLADPDCLPHRASRRCFSLELGGKNNASHKALHGSHLSSMMGYANSNTGLRVSQFEGRTKKEMRAAMNSVPKCEDLAPYLRQKLEQDKEYTWQTAPYIHEEVREALREVEYSVRSLSCTPVYRHGYSDLLNIYDYNANGYNSSAYLQMEMQRQIDAAQMQINQNTIDMLRNSAQQIIHRW